MSDMRKGDNSVLRVLASFFVMLAISGCLSSTKAGGSDGNGKNNGNGSGNSNSPPLISGIPSSAVKVGDVYSFKPGATDPDNDDLTFSIAGKPDWATFDSKNGKLTGQALLGDIGVYDNIRISVSDGTYAEALPAFSITVTDSALGALTLNWAAPTQNEDGSALTDLAGYNIYYGVARGNYPNRIHIPNPSINTYVVENLVPATYYIVATSFNSSGVESDYSNEAAKTVVAP